MKILFAEEGFPAAHQKIIENLPNSSKFKVEIAESNRPLKEQVADYDVLIPCMADITEDVIKAAKQLKIVVQFGVGLEKVDIKAACENGVFVTNTPGSNAVSVAEQALFLMLALARKSPLFDKSLAGKIIGSPMGETLNGKKLGIIGLGSSGRELATRAKALGMKVMATRKNPGNEDEKITDFIGTAKDLKYIAQNVDFLSLHLPLNNDTKEIIDRRITKIMKSNAFLINISRGGLISKNDLVQALKKGEIAGAGLDVYWEEPPDPEDEIFRLNNVVTTPHTAGVTEESYNEAAIKIIAHIERYLATGAPLFHYC